MSSLIIIRDLTPSQEALLGSLLASLQPHQAVASDPAPAPAKEVPKPLGVAVPPPAAAGVPAPLSDLKPPSGTLPPIETAKEEPAKVEAAPAAPLPRTKTEVQAALQAFLRKKGPDGTRLATEILRSVGASNVSTIPADKYATVIAALEA